MRKFNPSVAERASRAAFDPNVKYGKQRIFSAAGDTEKLIYVPEGVSLGPWAIYIEGADQDVFGGGLTSAGLFSVLVEWGAAGTYHAQRLSLAQAGMCLSVVANNLQVTVTAIDWVPASPDITIRASAAPGNPVPTLQYGSSLTLAAGAASGEQIPRFVSEARLVAEDISNVLVEIYGASANLLQTIPGERFADFAPLGLGAWGVQVVNLAPASQVVQLQYRGLQ